MADATGLDFMPDEIIHQIMADMNYVDLRALQRTNRRMFELVSAYFDSITRRGLAVMERATTDVTVPDRSVEERLRFVRLTHQHGAIPIIFLHLNGGHGPQIGDVNKFYKGVTFVHEYDYSDVLTCTKGRYKINIRRGAMKGGDTLVMMLDGDRTGLSKISVLLEEIESTTDEEIETKYEQSRVQLTYDSLPIGQLPGALYNVTMNENWDTIEQEWTWRPPMDEAEVSQVPAAIAALRAMGFNLSKSGDPEGYTIQLTVNPFG